MKSEKGGAILEIIIGFAILIIFLTVGYLIKEEIEYGTKEGIVIDMRYYSGYTTITHSGKWQIKIQKEINGENKEIWIQVDETTYHKLKIGDYYSKEEQ